MSKVILDGAMLSRLYEVKECVELCDASGNVIGYFAPKVDRSMYDQVEVPISDEELQRRAQATELYTTEQVLAHLKSLETQ